MSATPCLFCRIASRQLAAEIVVDDDELVAFHDINPQAPTHLLIIPKTHIARLSELTAEQAHLVGDAVVLANQLARQMGIAEHGYRIVINCGPQAGQSVDHLHVHLLGGRAMHWPPG